MIKMWEDHGNLSGESSWTKRNNLENVRNVSLKKSGDARAEGEGEGDDLVHERACFVTPSNDVRVEEC